MSVRLGVLVCLVALAACSHQPLGAIKSPDQAQPSTPPASELVTTASAGQEDDSASPVGDARTSRSDSPNDARSDADPELLRRIRQSSTADGSF